MNKFTVTYRAPSGRLEQIEIEAADRTAAFAVCKENEITVVRLSEGSQQQKKKITFHIPTWLYIVSLLIIIITIGLFLLSILGKSNSPQTKIKKSDPTPKHIDNPPPTQITNKVVLKTKRTSDPTPADAKGVRIAQARPRSQIRGPADRYEQAKKAGLKPKFKHEVESFLAMYAIPGQPVPPPPIDKSMKESFVNSLLEPIKILDSDTDEDIALKEMVQGMKEEMREYIKDGGSVEGYFKQLDERQEAEAAMWSDAHKLVLDEMKEDEASAYELWKAYNKKLGESGIKPLLLHPRLRKFLPPEEQF